MSEDQDEQGGRDDTAHAPLKPLRYNHEAMNTLFTIFADAADADPAVTASAAAAAFDLLDTIEKRISRFVPSSDICRVNDLTQGAGWRLGEHALGCLVTAATIAAATGRAFDPSAGALVDFWKKHAAALANPLPVTSPEAFAEASPQWRAAWEAHRAGEFALDPESRIIKCVTPGSRLDLGGIGKGYALDKMAELLASEWEISRALLSAGGSTMLALDAPQGAAGWKIGFGNPRLPRLFLEHAALSSSGTESQPTHLVDPRNGLPVTRDDLVRAIAPTAAEADALSTAFFIMGEDGAAALCETRPGCAALFEKHADNGADAPAAANGDSAGGDELSFATFGDTCTLKWLAPD